jgi:hypothetical protein
MAGPQPQPVTQSDGNRDMQFMPRQQEQVEVDATVRKDEKH